MKLDFPNKYFEFCVNSKFVGNAEIKKGMKFVPYIASYYHHDIKF